MGEQGSLLHLLMLTSDHLDNLKWNVEHSTWSDDSKKRALEVIKVLRKDA